MVELVGYKAVGDRCTLQIPFFVEKCNIIHMANDGFENVDFIIVDKRSEYFYSDNNGILYSADKKTLILYPPKKMVSVCHIKEGTKVIKTGAFFKCSFSIVTFPQSLQTIESHAFDNCRKLRKVILSDKIMFVGDEAFSLCDNLEKIIIRGQGKTFSSNAFKGCGDLKDVEIDASVEKLPKGIFFHNKYVDTIRIKNERYTYYLYGREYIEKHLNEILKFCNSGSEYLQAKLIKSFHNKQLKAYCALLLYVRYKNKFAKKYLLDNNECLSFICEEYPDSPYAKELKSIINDEKLTGEKL